MTIDHARTLSRLDALSVGVVLEQLRPRDDAEADWALLDAQHNDLVRAAPLAPLGLAPVSLSAARAKPEHRASSSGPIE